MAVPLRLRKPNQVPSAEKSMNGSSSFQTLTAKGGWFRPDWEPPVMKSRLRHRYSPMNTSPRVTIAR